MTRDQWIKIAERCEAATGPDDELDEAIHVAMGFVLVGPEGDCCWIRGEGRNMQVFYELPGLTGSLDAITALIERELPGWHGDVEVGSPLKGDGIYGARLFSRDCGDDEEWGDVADAVEVEAATPALALCAAFCRAMSEKGG